VKSAILAQLNVCLANTFKTLKSAMGIFNYQKPSRKKHTETAHPLTDMLETKSHPTELHQKQCKWKSHATTGRLAYPQLFFSSSTGLNFIINKYIFSFFWWGTMLDPIYNAFMHNFLAKMSFSKLILEFFYCVQADNGTHFLNEF